jgi:hypothetical protein
MSNNNQNTTNKALQTQIVAQWITSLAISVVCCAVLFIVFAGYIVELHDTTNLLTVKLEVLQERHNHLVSEVGMIKRPTVVNVNNGLQTPPPPQTSPEGMPQPAPNAAPKPPEGAMPMLVPEIGPNDPVLPPDVLTQEPKDDLMPVLNENDVKDEVLKPAKPAAPAKKP